MHGFELSPERTLYFDNILVLMLLKFLQLGTKLQIAWNIKNVLEMMRDGEGSCDGNTA